MSRRKAETKRKNPDEQLTRFKEMARELGADESPGALDRAFSKLNPRQKAPPRKRRG